MLGGSGPHCVVMVARVFHIHHVHGGNVKWRHSILGITKRELLKLGWLIGVRVSHGLHHANRFPRATTSPISPRLPFARATGILTPAPSYRNPKSRGETPSVERRSNVSSSSSNRSADPDHDRGPPDGPRGGGLEPADATRAFERRGRGDGDGDATL